MAAIRAKRKPKKRIGRKHVQAARKRAFLERFRTNGNISASCEGLVGRATIHVWLKDDPKFRAAFEHAREEAGDRLEEEARRRAAEGWLEPVYNHGERAGDWVNDAGQPVQPGTQNARWVAATVRKYSDRLLELLLKGAKPAKYRERHELTGRDGEPLPSSVVVVLPDNGRADRGSNE